MLPQRFRDNRMESNLIDNRQMEMLFGVLRREEGMYAYLYMKDRRILKKGLSRKV